MRVDKQVGALLLLPFLFSVGQAFHVPTVTRRTAGVGEVGSTLSISKTTLASTSSAESGVDAASGYSTKTPDMQAYAAGYKTVFEEVPCSVRKPSTGKIPEDLYGTYFRSGPAMFSAGSIPPPKTSLVQPKSPPVLDGEDSDRMVKHPFEGDGAVLGVSFPGDGTAVARFRFVRTNAFTNERKKGAKVYTGMESTRAEGGVAGAGQGNDFPLPLYKHHLLPGLNKKRKNTSNTRSIYWAKKLITLWEGGLPYKLDSLALSTEGRSQLGGVLKEKDPFGAKAAYDSSKDRMLFYSNNQDAKSSTLTIYEFDSKFRLVSEKGGTTAVELPGFALLSDFAVTENYSILVQPPVAANGLQFVVSKEPGKSLSVDKGGESVLHLIPRVGSGKGGNVKSFPIEFDGASDADLQFCNAFEVDGGEAVVMDVIRSDGNNVEGKTLCWPWASSLDDYSKSSSKKSLWRYKVQMSNGSVTKECISDLQASFGVVNPAVSGRKHQYVYAAVGSMGNSVAPPQGIAKFDVDSVTAEAWLPEEYEFCGEPMYASRKKAGDAPADEDDGYVLTVLFNGKTNESEMIVLDAKDIKAGPVARISLGLAVPHGYYGCFSASDEAGWSAEEIDRRAKLADKMEGRGSMWNEVKSDFSGLGLRLDDIEEYFGDFFG